jgi:hypothetical protein
MTSFFPRYFSRQSSSIFGLIFGLCLLAAVPNSYGQVPELECSSPTEIAKIKRKKSKIKTFVAEFWRAAEVRISKYPTDLKTKGFVVGDPHLENIDVFYARNSKPAIRLTFNDMDEAGYNFLVGDLLKLISYLPTIKKQGLNLEKVVDFYVAGLENKSITPPVELANLLAISPADYFKAERKYVAKQRIKGEELSLAKLSQTDFEAMTALKNTRAVSRLANTVGWTDTKLTGSSAGMTRYLFHGSSQIELANGSLAPIGVDGIIEYKEITCTATGGLEKQDIEKDLESFVKYDARFLGLPVSQTLLGRQAVVYVNRQHYLARTKGPNLYKDLQIEAAAPGVVQAHAEYLAWFLGQFHRESSSNGYTQTIRGNKLMLIDEAKKISKTYLK